MITTAEKYAWFAGFLEGEASIRFGSRYKRGDRQYGTPVIDIAQVNREPLDKCLKLFPCGHVYGPYQYGSNRQPHYKFMVVGRANVEGIFTKIKDYLSDKRKEQFAKTFEEHDKIISRPKLKRGPVAKGEVNGK